MPKPLKILLLEDSPEDAELIVRTLRRSGLEVEARRVASESEYASALAGGVDLILADYNLPAYDGLSALARLRESGRDVPLVLVSGAIGEELAAQAMVQGAAGFVMKSRLASLCPTVSRALEAAQARRDTRRAHEELQAEVDRRTAIEDAMRAGVQTFDLEGRVEHVNRFFCDLVGRKALELLGTTAPFSYWPPEQAQSLMARFEAERRGEAAESFETSFLRGDGARVDVLVSASPLVAPDGRRLGWMRLVYDVSEQKRLQQQMLHAQKMESIGILAGGVAHDFNNILTAILGNCGFLLNSLPAGSQVRGDVDEIKAAGERAAALTRQLLIFSRRQSSQPVEFDLNVTLNGVKRMVQRLLGEDIAVEFSLTAEPVILKGDPGHAEQVLMNLAVNARDAMPQGGRLRVTTALRGADERDRKPARVGRCVTLSVSDTGTGMPPEVATRVFEPFFTTKSVGKGTGLGLSTVYGIVQQFGGAISLETAPEKGTTFRIDLPCAAEFSEPVEPAATETAAATAAGEAVLIVEDDDAVRRAETRALSRLGYRVRGARSAEEALELIKREGEPLDLVLSDVVMPGMGGLGLAREVARLRPGAAFLFLTGFTEHEALAEIRALGHAVLLKPLTPDAIGLEVRKALDRRRPAGSPAAG